MKPTTTRTLNPLPFEHLEPKRFEDLSRQLVYNFKTWRQLEATGRAGSDDGFDARGYEIVPTHERPSSDDVEDVSDEVVTDRLWLIQCKRVGIIGPAKMRQHLADIPSESYADLHGLIFVASCNPSKETRDVLRQWCVAQGIAEWHFWGRAEIEDMLFQEINDNLLFAYFGISLQIRKRKAATDLRRIVTIKRKLKRLLEKAEQPRPAFIFRDPADTRYPYWEDGSLKNGTRLWRVLKAEGLGIFGLKVLVREHFAYYDREAKRWDVATGHNLALVDHHIDPWHERIDQEAKKKVEDAGRHFWLSIPGNRHLTAEFILEVRYEDIIEIDDVSNDDISMPTIFVTFANAKLPMMMHNLPKIGSGNQWDQDIILNGSMAHIRVFPDEARDHEFDALWQKGEKFSFAAERTIIPLTPPAWITDLEAMPMNSTERERLIPEE